MKKIYPLLVVILLVLGCKEPPAVEIIIADVETGAPIEGADVYVKKKWMGTSDENGVVKLVTKERRKVPLTVEKFGYFKKSITADNIGSIGRIDLQPKPGEGSNMSKSSNGAGSAYEDEEYDDFMDQLAQLDTSSIPKGCDYLGGMYSRDATFPGGAKALMAFIQNNVQYPEDAIDNDEQGKVYLSFVVTKEGKIRDVKVERGVSKSLDRESKRVVRSMPNWHPAYCNARPMATRCRLPIVFTLN